MTSTPRLKSSIVKCVWFHFEDTESHVKSNFYYVDFREDFVPYGLEVDHSRPSKSSITICINKWVELLQVCKSSLPTPSTELMVTIIWVSWDGLSVHPVFRLVMTMIQSTSDWATATSYCYAPMTNLTETMLTLRWLRILPIVLLHLCNLHILMYFFSLNLWMITILYWFSDSCLFL